MTRERLRRGERPNLGAVARNAVIGMRGGGTRRGVPGTSRARLTTRPRGLGEEAPRGDRSEGGGVMATVSLARIKRINRARRRRRTWACSWDDLETVGGPRMLTLTKYLEEARQRNDPARVTYWRQSITLTAASLRARDGDGTAERRLAWIKTLINQRHYAMQYRWRFKAVDSEIARMLHGGAPCGCCAQRLERLNENRNSFHNTNSAGSHRSPDVSPRNRAAFAGRLSHWTADHRSVVARP